MTHRPIRRGRLALPALAACLLVGLAAPPAAADTADDDPNRGRPGHAEPLDMPEDPLAEDNRITDDMEAGLPLIGAGVSCTPESVQTAPNPVPASPSFQLLYVHPSDATPASHMDVPRSCSDGSVVYSSIAKASRNLASWQASTGAGLNVRTQTINYVHNGNGSTYATRGVRRFKSPSSTTTWANSTTWDPASQSSPKLTRLQNELTAKGFNVASTRYAAVLDAPDRARCNAQNQCSIYAGVANYSGPYSLSIRYWVRPDGSKVYYRFGCATTGDSIMGHETVHQVGANHVSDHAYDLMAPTAAGGRNFRQGVVWDLNRDNYHAKVYGSVYVGKTGLAGNYFTCT